MLTPDMFPPHKCELSLTHNEHRSYYETAKTWLERFEHEPPFVSLEARQRAIDTDEVWVLQWYPATPVGFNVVAAPTLAEVLEAWKDSC